MKTLGVIPARGGSKGIPRKNIAPLAGRPLLDYTAAAALAARRLDSVILSTDDEEIAEIGRQCGLETPFIRPPELARDDTPTAPVLRHAVAALEELGRAFDAVCLLQPTSPFRAPGLIDACIELLASSGADSTLTVRAVPDEFNPHWVYFEDPTGCLRLATGEATPIPRRQALPRAYHRDGSVYVVRRDTLMGEGGLYGEKVVGLCSDAQPSVNIDAPEDLARAERLLGEYQRAVHIDPAAAPLS